MATTRAILSRIDANVDESMGARTLELQPQFAPIAAAKDVGRLPLRRFGQIDVDRVIADPDQPRTFFNPEEIQHLANSIRDNGQLHPIRVRWNQAIEKWIIITGERRWQATQLAGLEKIDCYFIDGEINPAEILEQQLVENLIRQDLKPLEEAHGYAAIMEFNGWNGKQVAQSLHVSPSRVSRSLALLDLPNDVQQQINNGELPKSSAYELSKLNDESTQRTFANMAAAGTLTKKQAEKVVRQHKGKPKPKTCGVRLTFPAENGFKTTITSRRAGTYHEVEEALAQALEEVRHRINNNVQLF